MATEALARRSGFAVGPVCAHCRVVHRRAIWAVDGDMLVFAGFSMVDWPCASSVRLGLISREEPFDSPALGRLAMGKAAA